MRSSQVDTISSPSSAKSRFPAAWVLAAGLLLLAFIVYRAAAGARGFDWALFQATLLAVDPAWACLAILFIILSYFGRAIRWEAMMRPFGAPPSLYRLFVGSAIGFTAVVLLGRAGELVRPWWIARESGTPFAAQLAIWFSERIYDLFTVILFFGYALIRIAGSGVLSALGPQAQWILSGGGAAALALGLGALLFLLGLRLLRPAHQQQLVALLDHLPAPLATRLRPLATQFLAGAAASCSPRQQGLVLLYTLLEWAVIAACYWAVLRAFAATHTLSWPDIIALMGLVSFGSIVQLPGIGGGMQVTAIAVLTQLFGIGLEAAASVALFLWFIAFASIVPLGLLLAFTEGIQFRRLRHLSQESLS